MNRGIRRRRRQPVRRLVPTKPVSMVARRTFGGHSGLGRPALMLVALITVSASIAPAGVASTANDRVTLFPKLVAGQVLTYQITYHADKSAATKSTVATSRPQSPSGTDSNVRALLRLEIS